MKKAVITGVTGFIGSALAKRLLADGVQVYGVGRDMLKMASLCEFANFHPVEADFQKYGILYKLMPDGVIDVFYHFAWDGTFGDAFKNYPLQLANAHYSCDAVGQAVKMGCNKFVYAQTYNYYEIKSFINSAVFSPRYTCIYSAAKTCAELIMKTIACNSGLDFCSGAICMSYGENNKSRMLPNIVLEKLLKNERPKLIEGNNLYDLIYISDIVEAFVALGEYGVDKKTYYVGHRKLKTFKEWMIGMRDIVSPELGLVFGEYRDDQQIDYSQIDLDSLYNDTGFECKADFRESIVNTAKWLGNYIENNNQ